MTNHEKIIQMEEREWDAWREQGQLPKLPDDDHFMTDINVSRDVFYKIMQQIPPHRRFMDTDQPLPNVWCSKLIHFHIEDEGKKEGS